MSLSRGHLVRKHLKHSPGASLVVALIVAILTCGVTVLPHLISSIRQNTLQQSVDDMSPSLRDLVGSVNQHFNLAGGTAERLPESTRAMWGDTEAVLQKMREEAPTPLRQALQDPHYVVTAGDMPPLFDGRIMVSLNPLYENHLNIVEGRLPEKLPDSSDEPKLEIILSKATAERLGWKVGDTRVTPLTTLKIIYEDGSSDPDPQIALVGTFELDDPQSSYWSQLPQYADATANLDEFGQASYTGYAFAAPETLRQVSELASLSALYWLPVDTSKITESNAATVGAQLETFTSKARTVDGVSTFSFVSKLGPTLDRVTAANQSLTSIVVMFVAGPVGVGLAVMLLGTRMIIQHRRNAFALLDARGASGTQRRGLLGLEGVLAGVPAGVAGAALGVLIVLTIVRTSSAALFTPLTIALVVAISLFPAAALIVGAPRSGSVGRVDERRAPRARLFAEIAVLIIAAVAVVTLLNRGVGDPAAPIDPLASVTPLILTLVAAMLTVRVYPLILNLLHSREARGSGFIGFVGSARAVREAASGAAALLALLVGVSIAASSTVVISTIDASAQRSADLSAGAELSLSVPRFGPGAADQVRAVDGVDEVLEVRNVPNVALDVRGQTLRVALFSLDSAAYQKMVGKASVIPSGVELTSPDAIPIIISQSAADRFKISTGPINVGSKNDPVEATIVAIVDDATGFSNNSMWLLADESNFETLTSAVGTVSTLFVDVADGVSPQRVADSVKADVEPSVTAKTPASVREGQAAAAASSGLRGVLLVAIGIAALMCAIAVVMTLILGAPARARLLALLKTLGAPPRSGSGIVAWELVPLCVAAVVSGLLFGLALPLLLFRVLDLRPFAGTATAPPYVIDPQLLLISVGGFILIAALFTFVSLFLARRVKVASVLRTVEDS